MLSLVVFIVIVALVFDFINGFHDAANSIATRRFHARPDAAAGVVWARLQLRGGLRLRRPGRHDGGQGCGGAGHSSTSG